MGAMNVNGCRGRAWVAQITSKSVSGRTKILFDEQWEDALRQDLTPKIDPCRNHPRKKAVWYLKLQSGPLWS